MHWAVHVKHGRAGSSRAKDALCNRWGNPILLSNECPFYTKIPGQTWDFEDETIPDPTPDYCPGVINDPVSTLLDTEVRLARLDLAIILDISAPAPGLPRNAADSPKIALLGGCLQKPHPVFIPVYRRLPQKKKTGGLARLGIIVNLTIQPLHHV